MKKPILFYTVGAIVLLLCGCSEQAYKLDSQPTKLPTASGSIQIDDSYELYSRAVTADEQTISGKTEKTIGLYEKGPANISAGVKKGQIIEIEYLFVSRAQGRVIYISTAADRYENRYSSVGFTGLDHPNAADFRVFLIGRIVRHDHFTFYFKDGKHTDNWTVITTGGRIGLQRIEQQHFGEFEEVYEIHDALKHAMSFVKEDHWSICYRDPSSNASTALEPLVDKKLYYAQDGQKYTLWLSFPDQRLYWPNKYVAYKPD